MIELQIHKHTAIERAVVTSMLKSKRKTMAIDYKDAADRGAAQSERMLRWFEYEQLPPHLQMISKPFGDLARQLCGVAGPCAERTAGLRKLLEAKDCAVRAYIEAPIVRIPPTAEIMKQDDIVA